MHPLIVDLSRNYRGGQHQALLLLQGLLERGHAPELIAIRDSLLECRARDAGIHVHGVGPRRRRLAAAMEIRQRLNAQHVGLVHANEPHALTSAWLARAHHFAPLIASRRIALPLSSNLFALARYRAAKRIIAVSHFVENSVLESGLPKASVDVIYDGVEIPPAISRSERDDARARFAISPENSCAGNIAAFVPEKGHALLLRAFAKLRAQVPGCVLLLRGEGPEEAKLQNLAEQLQLLEAVKFLPPTAEIKTVFAAMDIFVFPSHEEPLGSALLAAMAHGLPVAAIARGGIPEAVEDEKNGLLVKNLIPDELASAMARLLSDPFAASRLGKAARDTVITQFSANRMVEETLRLYESLLTTLPDRNTA